ncbi:hypothetical protein Py04_0388 [Pyrococcus sp. ST04]|nr:hypothetical protein Py04_0388 [Pyrococcus sp. ST04]
MLKYDTIRPRHITIIGIVLVASYAWIFAMAVGMFRGNFMLSSLCPSLILGGALVYLAFILWEHVVEKRSLQALFPLGIAGVGVLNLTYPFTRHVDWFYPLAFLGAAIFRLIAAIGALKMVIFVPKTPQKTPHLVIKPGAYWTTDEGKALDIASKMNTVMITRKHPTNEINSSTLVYWVTKVREGEIRENVYAISPTKIDILTDLIAKAFKVGYNLLYIDCLEFLILENGFNPAMKFLYTVKDIAIENNGSILLVINPRVLDEHQMKIIEKEFQKL